jgi:hypothetical protein
MQVEIKAIEFDGSSQAMLPFKVIISFYSSDNQEIPNLYFI